jgi:peptidoglycan/xylan/chitin deacetylase (PgdA/CDA1 family)
VVLLRRVGVGFGVVVVVGLVALLIGPRKAPPASIEVSAAGRLIDVARGTTLAAVAERVGLRPPAGDLLSVDGRVLRPGVFPGAFTLDGRPALPRTPLAGQERIAVVAGHDQTEPRLRTLVAEPSGAPSDPQFFVDHAPGKELIVRGAISHQLVSATFQQTGAARAEHAVALTFDDGPSPEYTPRVLARLAKLHARASFFVIGYLAAQYPRLVRLEARMGMAVGNHSYNHPQVPPFAQLPEPLLRDEIALGDQALARLGIRTQLFRPPGGGSSARLVRIAAELGQRVVLWSVDPQDWKPDTTAKQIAARVLAAVRPGSIVELHDGGGDRSATLAALPAIVHGIRARGLRIVTLNPSGGPNFLTGNR